MSAASLPRTHSRMHPAVRSALGDLPSAPARLAPGRGPAPVFRMPHPAPGALGSPGRATATIDCDSCPVRSWSACSGCVVAVLIGFPPGIEPVGGPVGGAVGGAVSGPVGEPFSGPVGIRRRCGDHTAAARPHPLLPL